MNWRVALIDSCGAWPGALATAAFISDGGRVIRREPAADASGHGSRLAELITGPAGAGAGRRAKPAGGAGAAVRVGGAAADAVELLLAQVFLNSQPATGAAVAAAIEWVVAEGANLMHMSLGLAADRAVLAEAVGRAIDHGCIIVASTPARGAPVYPASYPRVIRATGDARCAAGEISQLAPWFFGGCPYFERASQDVGRGASVGAAWVTRGILHTGGPQGADEVVAALTAGAQYRGPERRRE